MNQNQKTNKKQVKKCLLNVNLECIFPVNVTVIQVNLSETTRQRALKVVPRHVNKFDYCETLHLFGDVHVDVGNFDNTGDVDEGNFDGRYHFMV